MFKVVAEYSQKDSAVQTVYGPAKHFQQRRFNLIQQLCFPYNGLFFAARQRTNLLVAKTSHTWT
jgi:hypothetical protein